ncbi:hypothetical protein M2321_002691 [Rhodoblastus acidophilus]|nr:hypothetical protein [Rhodoblastus acidophilus]
MSLALFIAFIACVLWGAGAHAETFMEPYDG